ncbi:S1 family peptidase [Streptomyces sp. SP18CS02]|uniref:S1 family peptidase n=1 Tax=Streptomyces sp. SP18CS02 TaxID=3002531 RepID=UPI002E7A27A0|nr:S1 family peptidase [Streptomyces sp. SP18CS02]MEE1754490.1 S1 family peptidase [Streptomyces sp. SP18CS02]
MKRQHTYAYRHIAAMAGVAALVFGSLTAANATAAQSSGTKGLLTSAAASDLAGNLTSSIKGATAGAYYDAAAKKLVVNVVDLAAAERVEKAGAEARLVKHSQAQLNSVKKDLDATAAPGTSRGIDPISNQVVVTADRTVTGAALKSLERQVAAQNGKAVLHRTAGSFQPLLSGGDAIYSPRGRCSLGFNVVKDGRPYFLTAGHCAAIAGTSWSDADGAAAVGTAETWTFPGQGDHALVRYTADVPHPSEVNLYNGSTQQITAAREAVVGEKVQRSGSTTRVHDGSVLALDVSVTYAEGTVHGLIQTDVCAERGDSGGAMFAGSDALGLTSGGSGNCSLGGRTFFTPVTDALSAYGASIG